MSKKPLSLALSVVLAGLLIQVFGIVYGVSTTVGWTVFVTYPDPPVEISTLVVLIGCLVLMPFVWQGRKWAVIASIPVQLLMGLLAVPRAIQLFGNPVDLNNWLLAELLAGAGLVAASFGVVAARERSDRASPAGWRHEGGGLSRQGAVLMAVLVAFGSVLGMVATLSVH